MQLARIVELASADQQLLPACFAGLVKISRINER
jgi:hypothetical protein